MRHMFNGYWIGLAAISAGALSFGCGSGAGFKIDRLEVQHAGWDTLIVDLAFSRSALGGAAAAQPDSMRLYVFDSAYDTLYAGADTRVALPDEALGDRERLLVEVCGFADRHRVCEQAPIHASRKRITLAHDFEYPIDASYGGGRYTLDFQWEREVFGEADVWEPIVSNQRPIGRLVGRVADQPQTMITLPIRRTRDRFDLSDDPRFSEFRYQIESRLLDGLDADVLFTVEARLGPSFVPVETIERPIRIKTDDERAEDVIAFVEQATAQLVDRLGLINDDGEAPSVTAYLDDWSYNRLNRRYTIEVEIDWRARRGLFGRDRRHRMNGQLLVSERGRDATFTFQNGSRDARDRWQRYLQRPTVSLRALRPAPSTAPAAVSSDEP